MLKKIVVVYPNPTATYGLDKKEFAVKTEEEHLKVNNTDEGCLVIICDAELPHYKPITLAVFKEWIYWERINEKDDEQEPDENALDSF